MKAKVALLTGLVVALAGCTVSAPDDDDDDDDDDQIECSSTDRIGTYLLETPERDGTCGAIPSQVGRVEDPTALPVGCVLDAPDRWSDGGCSLERAYTCTDAPNNLITSWTGITTQQDSNGDLVTGVLSVRATELDGTFVCSSTYGFRAERQ